MADFGDLAQAGSKRGSDEVAVARGGATLRMALSVLTAISEADIPAGIARDAEVAAAIRAVRGNVAASMDTLAELAAAIAKVDVSSYAALAGATFTGPVKGPNPAAAADLATKAYVDAAVAGRPVAAGGDFYFGVSDDATPEAAELTVASSDGSGVIRAYEGEKHVLIARLRSEADLGSLKRGDDDSQTNQIGAFSKSSTTVVKDGKTYKVWVSNQALEQTASVTWTAS